MTRREGDTPSQGRTKHLKLGGTTLRGHFLVKKKRAFSKNKGALICLLKNHGGMCPSAPCHYVYATSVPGKKWKDLQ